MVRILSYGVVAFLLMAISFLLGGAVEEYANKNTPAFSPVAGFMVACPQGVIGMGYTDSEGNLYTFSSQYPADAEASAKMNAVPEDARHIFMIPCPGQNNQRGANAQIQAYTADQDRGRHDG